MPPVRTGVDLVQVERVARLLERYGDRFAHKIFTEVELATCDWKAERLAVRLAAKEAVAKALGTGIGQVRWRDIQVVNNAQGQPELELGGRAAVLAAELGLVHWSISLSHTNEHAIASVVASS